MQANGQQIIAREGWPVLVVIFFLAVISKVYLGWMPVVLLLCLFLVIVYILRNPYRVIPSAPLAILSPASGVVKSVEKVHEKFLSRPCIKLQLKTSLWDMHALVSPIEGKVMKQWMEEIDGADYNRRYSYWIQTDEGDDVVMSLLLGKWSPFTRMFMRSGERVGQGQYCGFLYYTGAVEVYLPTNSRIDIVVGDRMCSGSDILGRFIHENRVTVVGK